MSCVVYYFLQETQNPNSVTEYREFYVKTSFHFPACIHTLPLFLNNLFSGRYWNASLSWNKLAEKIYYSFLIGTQEKPLKQHPVL